MMSEHHLLAAGINHIIVSGKAVLKNEHIQEEIKRQYKLTISKCEVDAAVGAALAVLNLSAQLKPS